MLELQSKREITRKWKSGRMDKYDFSNRLRMALTGKVPKSDIEDSIRFYEDYIDMEMRKGKSEKEVLEALGDPGLLAKSIIAAEGESSAGENEYGSYAFEQGENESEGRPFKGFRVRGWAWILGALLFFVCVLVIMVAVLNVFAPVLIPILLVLLIVSMVRRS